jgi:hypothetical protein
MEARGITQVSPLVGKSSGKTQRMRVACNPHRTKSQTIAQDLRKGPIFQSEMVFQVRADCILSRNRAKSTESLHNDSAGNIMALIRTRSEGPNTGRSRRFLGGKNVFSPTVLNQACLKIVGGLV